MKIKIEKMSWVKRGSQRREIIQYIEDEDTPSEIAKKSGYSLNHTSKILNEFKKEGLVKVLNEKAKTGRLYMLTIEGKEIKKKMKKE